MTTCECDYDLVDDPPRYIRCNRSILCPEHDMCCCCDERLAVIIDDGDKLCADCALEEIVRCPNCGHESSFDERETVHREPYGDFVEDQWLVCIGCRKRTDAEELKRFNAARLADIRKRLEAAR